MFYSLSAHGLHGGTFIGVTPRCRFVQKSNRSTSEIVFRMSSVRIVLSLSLVSDFLKSACRTKSSRKLCSAVTSTRWAEKCITPVQIHNVRYERMYPKHIFNL